MKTSFASEQKAPLHLLLSVGILCTPMLYVLLAIGQVSASDYGIATLFMGAWWTFVGAFIWKYRLLFGYVLVDENGVRVMSKSGKARRSLAWAEIQTATVTREIKAGVRYICLSAKPSLPWNRTTYGGVLYTMFYEKNAIAFAADFEMLAYVRAYLRKQEREVEEVVNPNTGR